MHTDWLILHEVVGDPDLLTQGHVGMMSTHIVHEIINVKSEKVCITSWTVGLKCIKLNLEDENQRTLIFYHVLCFSCFTWDQKSASVLI